MDHTFFYRSQPRDLAQLRAVSTDHLCTLVVTLFTQFEKHTYIDDETLNSAGLAVAQSGHTSVDDAALAWLAASPTDRRLAQVSAFLAATGRTRPSRRVRLNSIALSMPGSALRPGILDGDWPPILCS